MLMNLVVENNNKFVRGKGTSLKKIELYCLSDYQVKRLESGPWAYELAFNHKDDQTLEEQIYDLATEMESMADLRNGFTQSSFYDPVTEKSW